MPRHKKLEDLEFVEKMKEFFKESKNTQDLSEKLNISKKTCQRYLTDLDLHYPKGRPKGKKSNNRKTGGMANWIKTHPGETLSLNVSDIIKQTDLTKDQIKSFLYRTKKKHLKRLSNIGDIRDYRGGLRGTQGMVFLFSDIKEYSIKHSFLNEDLKITITLKNKEKVTFKTTFSILEKFNKTKT